MTAPTTDRHLLVFGELLTDLRRSGFRVGVGHYLRLQELLHKAGPEAAPEDLKTLLCPLFATSQAEQEHFYRAFDNLFDFYRLTETARRDGADGAGIPLAVETQPPPTARRAKHYYIPVAVVAVLLLAAVLVWRYPRLIGVDEQPNAAAENAQPQAASPQTAAPAAAPTPAQEQKTGTALTIRTVYERLAALWGYLAQPLFLLVTILSPLTVFLFYDQPLWSSGVRLKFPRPERAALLWALLPAGLPGVALIAAILYYSPLRYEFFVDYFRPAIKLVSVLFFLLFLLLYRVPPHRADTRPALYQRLRPFILGLAVLTSCVVALLSLESRAPLFAPFVFFLIYEWHRYRRRRLILQKQHGRKPPYVWPVRVEAFAPKLFEPEVFYATAREMRRRQPGEHERLDVEATVRATVAALGYPAFRYRLMSRPPEYLVLIDRAGFRDHQAQLFFELTKALEGEGVYVAPYFFDGDPRVCCEESGGGCLPLAELRSRYAGHRLLVFGDGELLLDPVTGEAAPWSLLFAEWPDRALLTPRAAADWGLREIELAGLFVVLPATLESLLALVAHFEARTDDDARLWRRGRTGQQPPNFLRADAPGLVAGLRAYLGERAFQWLAACAVYPELHWDLTLYLGSLPAMGGGLISEENLSRLIRLPWFRSGSIPDDVRWLLIRELDWEKERAVRAVIVELLEKNPPPAETYAAETYQLNLVVQRWLSRRDRRRQHEELKALDAVPRNQIARDYTLLRFLEASASPALSLLLPSRLRRLFYRDGIPAFGLKTGARLLCVVAITLAALAAREVAATYAPPSQRTMKVRLNFITPNITEIVNESRDEISVTVEGASLSLNEINPRDLSARVDLSNHKPGNSVVQLTPQNVMMDLPGGVSVVKIEPGAVSLRLGVTVMIDTIGGKADVYKDGLKIGETPYLYDGFVGETGRLTLKREGFEDLQAEFAITDQTRSVMFPMRRKARAASDF